MVEIFSLEQHCCSTCTYWEGARILGECQHIYAMREILGCCRMRREQTTTSDSCTRWGVLHIAVDELEIAYGNSNAGAAQARHRVFQQGFSGKQGRCGGSLASQPALRRTLKYRKIGEIDISSFTHWILAWASLLKMGLRHTTFCKSRNSIMSSLSRLLLLIVLVMVLVSYNRVFAAEPTHSTHAGSMPSPAATVAKDAAPAPSSVETAEGEDTPVFDDAKPAPFWLGFRLPEAMFNGCGRNEE